MLCQIQQFLVSTRNRAPDAPTTYRHRCRASVLPAGVDPGAVREARVVTKAQAGAGGCHRPRLPDRQRLEGLPAHRPRQRDPAARRPAPGRAVAATGVHAFDQGRGRRPRRDIDFDTVVRTIGADLAETGARGDVSACTRSRATTPLGAGSSSPTPSSSSAPTPTAACT